jgi:predicted amidohydrolase YtcJ
MTKFSIPNELAAELALINGKIVTVDTNDTIAEAIAVKNGKIIKVGTSDEIQLMINNNTRMIDLEGRTVLPGLTDTHVHMISSGTRMLDPRKLDCRDFYHPEIESIKDIINKIKEHSVKTPIGEWIVAMGSPMADFRLKEKRYPNKKDLDKATTKHPTFISFGAHITVTNSLGLKIAGITKQTANPVAGIIVKDETGEPTGLLREKAQNLISNLTSPRGKELIENAIKHGVTIPSISSYTIEDLKNGVKSSVEKCLERGVTTVHDIVSSPDEIRAYQEVLEEGNLRMRIHLLIRTYEAQIKAENVLNLGLKTGFGNNWLKIGGIKMSIDGGMTGCNAAFYEPYVHEPWNTGVVRIPQNILDDLVIKFHKAGHRLCVHAIGDRAFDMIFEAYKKALTETPCSDHRHRIEHGPGNYMLTPKRLNKTKELDIFQVPNINFLYYFGDPLLTTLGLERMKNSFPLKMLLDEKVKFSSGTDAPGYMPVDVLRDIWTCVTRKSWSGTVISPEQAISVMDAIRVFTLNAAYAGFEEDIKGSIEIGKLADLIILNEDILTIEADRLKDIKVDYTIVNGEIVYKRL